MYLCSVIVLQQIRYKRTHLFVTRNSWNLFNLAHVRSRNCDLGAMIVQQGYKSSFMILYGHSRLDRPNEKFCWVYVQLPTHPYCSKNVWLCRFQSYVAKRFKIFHEFLSLYDI